jgi:glucokinase
MPEQSVKTYDAVGIEAGASAFVGVGLSGSEIEPLATQPITPGLAAIGQLYEFLGLVRERAGVSGPVGVAVPGLVNRETGRVAFSANIPEHSDIDLAGQILSETGIKTRIENDANAAAFGEFRLGAGRGAANLFYATLGQGIGGCFIFDGRIWRGRSGFAGEFGYVAINSDGTRLEDVASSDNIVRRTRNRFNRDSTSSLNRYAEQSIGLHEIVAAADAGDDFAQMMLMRTGVYVGTAVANVINLLNIEKIVLGGEIMRTHHTVLDAVARRAKELSFSPSFADVEIVAGELGEYAAAAGAALLAAESRNTP